MNSCPFCAEYLTSNEPVEAEAPLATFSSRGAHRIRSRFAFCRRHEIYYNTQALLQENLENSYEMAPFVSGVESLFAARDYIKYLKPFLKDYRPASVLDVGAGDAAFLHLMHEEGVAHCRGLELNHAARRRAQELYGVHLEHSSFESYETSESYDWITFFQVLSHLPNPQASVEKAMRILKKNGLLIVVDHDPSCGAQRLLGSRSPVFDPTHFHLWTGESLIRLVEDQGMRALHSRPLANRYPLSYWLKMSLGLGSIHPWVESIPFLKRCFDMPVRVSAGNRIWVFQKF